MEMAFVIGVILFGLLIYIGLIVLPKISKTGPPGKSRGLDQSFYISQWAEIEGMLSIPGRGKTAVMEADKLLDHALKAKGARGQNMGERLRSSGKWFSNLNAIWSAHKMRNILAHEAGTEIPHSQLELSVRQLQQGLRDLGAL